MNDIGSNGQNKRSRSAQKAARTKAVKQFDKKIKELEELLKEVKDDEVDTTKANTIIRIYSCMLDWTKAKREVYLEEILAADVRSLREELQGDVPDNAA
jgi:hypothetical protein